MKIKNIFFIFQLILVSFSIISTATVYEINQNVDSEYKKVEFIGEQKLLNHYFKYTVTENPSSRIGAFRIEFDSFNQLSYEMNRVFCTFVETSASDDELIQAVGLMDDSTSNCIGSFTEDGIYDGIIKYPETKKKLAIYLVAKGHIDFTARLFLRTKEKQLSVNEQKVIEDSSYSMIPYTITISHFRQYASKILFYSYTRELQMYYLEEESPYPQRIFFGNILSVYTNPNMVRQKYRNADTMVLLTRRFEQEEMVGEPYQFQVKFFASDYLLDYYMGSNLEGRSKNTPLSINMTECDNPYYVVLNYNTPEKEISLYIDEIYGKIKSLSVAPTLSSPSWEEMIEKDLQHIEATTRKFVLPKNSPTHIDVYKIECDVPLFLNFYYIDESASIPNLDYGNVVITTLKAYKSVSLPFSSGINLPQLTIEIFNPIKLPFVIVDDGQNESIITKNSVIKSMPFTTSNPIIIKERNGDSDTRIIVKVGYSTSSWEDYSTNIIYNKDLNIYVFSFPADIDKLNYTYALLETSGTNADDNVKYCYATNIGSAILPSSENCYRVSKDNSYTIKVLNPLVMYKEYDVSDQLNYYVSLKPTSKADTMNIKVTLGKYGTTERNFEGVGNNVQLLTDGKQSTILSSPTDKDEYISVQIQSCDDQSKLTFSIFNGYDTNKQIVPDTEIPANKKNYYIRFKNIFLETELKLTGNSATNVFVKHSGVTLTYSPSIKDSYPLTFNENLNQLIVENPLKTSERMKYTVFVGKIGSLSSKKLTLCSFAEIKETIAEYNKTYISFSDKTEVNINFNKIGLEKGQGFEAIAFIEQEPNSQMSFLTELLIGTVGEIKSEVINEINTVYETDTDYVYSYKTLTSDDLTFYFSYLPSTAYDVPVGAFRIQLDSDSSGDFSRVSCAFVNDGEDASSMVEAVEEVISGYNSYCIGGKSKTNSKIYNYMVRYSYTQNNEPRRLVIKLTNNNANGGFTIYVRKGENIYLETSDFTEQKEYGRQEEYRKSIIPYIVDLEKIRGDSENYVSKVLIYSEHLEMQMYYLDSTEERHDPILLFTGNIMLVYTNLALAIQKYHATKLVLLSESINGQEHSSLGNLFRFHTKMFRSTDQIEYFVSNNPSGRTINYPLSVEMNTCTSNNTKYYYILNYNQAEPELLLHLDLVFGSLKSARIANEINAEKWDILLENSMTTIYDYQTILSEKSQHIDVIEFECNTPLLINVYYTNKNQIYSGLRKGDIVVKNLGGGETFSFTIGSLSGLFYYSISTFNVVENPDITIVYDNTNRQQIQENSLHSGFLLKTPYNIYIINNGYSSTRVIYKIGYGVESEWIDEKEKIEGKLYSQGNQYVYKFPIGDNKRNFTDVVLDIKPIRKDTQEESENIKFCYSTSIGMPIDASRENCYRTGANIPYSLTFINPLISAKNYKSYSDNYYVTISPFSSNEYISLGITENIYDTKERNIEGVNNIIKLNSIQESTILSVQEKITNTEIVIQLQACNAQSGEINYENKNIYTGDIIYSGTIKSSDKRYYYIINNNLMETKLELNGVINDLVFVKHSGINNYPIILQNYYSTFNKDENTVNIIKPIKDESFIFTVLVGIKGRFNEYSLCTFSEKKDGDFSQLGDYVKTFTSVSSNTITHFIDFRSFSYKEGDEFDLLVYAVQMENSKLELLYDVISGTVGKIKGITEITEMIDSDYVRGVFTQNTTSNYLFYDFKRDPIGDVASLKIINTETGMKVNKVGCTFVRKGTEDIDMVSAVNKAMMESTSVCVGQTEKDTNGFDALISAKDVKNGYVRLVLQVVYGIGEGIKNEKNAEGEELTIQIRVNGFKVDSANQYNEKEELTLMPYVLDLKEIRNSDDNYISKVMVYSNTREMQMFYLENGAPTELFSGNIMLVYTNPEVIKEKYKGATTMILLTDSLSKSGRPVIGEQFKFKSYFLHSDNTMQYYVSANPQGRLLNNPTSLEMPSCDVPYYYILNYNFAEGDRVLHIDNIFGEINTIKIANELNKNDWYELVGSMESFTGNEYNIEGQSRYHMDVIEVTCKIPTLINIYYTDKENPKVKNLDQGDISIIDLGPSESEILSFKQSLLGEFIYSFNVFVESQKPNIQISFEGEEEMNIDKNGIFTKNSNKNYQNIKIENKEFSGNMKTKVIFKFGYNIDSIFTKIQNNIYNLQSEGRVANLFAYKFNTGEDMLNTTSIDFRISTSFDNVKFCYVTNLGAFIDPSLQNCYRVGRSNAYTISVLNPYLMHKNYYIGENEGDVLDYYVAFQTTDIDLNITITPTLKNYTIETRNIENIGNTISLRNGKGNGTILTAPKNNEYLFVQMDSCTENASFSYEFKNAYNSSSLNHKGEINSNSEYNYINVENTKLDTELDLIATKNSAEIFIRHTGIDTKYQPIIDKINIYFDGKKKLNFTQPIKNEEFKYTIYLDKQGNLKNYTLCQLKSMNRLAHYTTSVVSDKTFVELVLDFNNKALKGYEKFDIFVLAEGTDNGKFIVISKVYQFYAKDEDSSSSSNTILVIILIVLAILLVAGGITAFVLLRRYKLKPDREKLDAKETSLADVDNKNEKMITSTATQGNNE